MTSFKAMIDPTKGMATMNKVTDKDRYLSYLPVAHGMERWLGEVRRIHSNVVENPYSISSRSHQHLLAHC
jgi:long-subunit acyl-CoA synthetase (AMP-forming)